MSCLTDRDCSFLYHCTEELTCHHNPAFDFSWYTILIYLLVPIGSGLVNSTGHSMGLFKVLLVMNALRYEGVQATMITQAMIVGTAIPNYFSMLVRRHPQRQTSLVNFNLVYILVPCCLLGSTLGSLITEFIPSLIQNILIFLVFLYFAFSFYTKYQKIKSKQQQTHQQSILTKDLQPNSIVSQQTLPHPSPQQQIPSQQNHQQSQQQKQIQRQKILKYEKSIHLQDVLFSVAVFIVFEFIVFLVQGKLPFAKFQQCDWKYWMGLVLLVGVTLGYLKFIWIFLNSKFQTYQSLNLPQQIMLNNSDNFNFILLAGFLAGLAQGILGVGSGSCMMVFLLRKNLNAQSASATAGYQVLFIGLAALIQGFINGSVNVADSIFFIVLCFVLGGAVTLTINYILKRHDQVKVSKFVVITAVCLSMVSVIMVIPSTITTTMESGIGKMMEIKFKCHNE